MSKGFSLIELMITLALGIILLNFAYPHYAQYIIKARRCDGQAALFNLAGRMEQYYFANNTYQTATIGTGKITDVLTTIYSPEGWYRLSLAVSDTAYALQATPLKTQGLSDLNCQSLTLNSIGVKDITTGPQGIPTGPKNRCW